MRETILREAIVREAIVREAMQFTIRQTMILLLCISLALGLSGCVSITKGPFTDKISEEKAVKSYIALGYGYLEAGKVALAKQRIERALEIQPDNPEVHTVMALIWQKEGEAELAREYFEKAVDERDDIPKTNHLYSDFLISQGECSLAIRYLENVALELDYPERAQIYQNLGVCYRQMQQMDKAYKAFKKAQRLNSSLPSTHLNAAELAFERKEYQYAEKSFAAFRKLVALKKAKHSAQSAYLGILMSRHSQDKEAETAYVKLLYRNFKDTQQFQAFMDGYRPFLR